MNTKDILWNEEKNEWLKRERGISFEDVSLLLETDSVLYISRHPNQTKYPEQHICILEIHGYAYVVPFVETQTEIFLKTIFPSRKATKQYIKRKLYET